MHVRIHIITCVLIVVFWGWLYVCNQTNCDITSTLGSTTYIYVWFSCPRFVRDTQKRARVKFKIARGRSIHTVPRLFVYLFWWRRDLQPRTREIKAQNETASEIRSSTCVLSVFKERASGAMLCIAWCDWCVGVYFRIIYKWFWATQMSSQDIPAVFPEIWWEYAKIILVMIVGIIYVNTRIQTRSYSYRLIDPCKIKIWILTKNIYK